MGLDDPAYFLRWAVRMGNINGVRATLKAGIADPLEGGKTIAEWAPLHIACWGTLKPAHDKDIVEALLLWAQKAKKEDAIRNAEDKMGRTPCMIAKARRDALAAQAPAAGGEEGGAAVEEKRKYDKIIEWLEKGLPQA